MVNTHHIISQLAEQRVGDIHREVAIASRGTAAEPRRSRWLRLRRTARTRLVAAKETVR